MSAPQQVYTRTDFTLTGTVAQQTLTFSGVPDQGVYRIKRASDGATTATIAFDAANSVLQTQLRLFSGFSTITVSGSASGPYTVVFTGVNGEVPLLTIVANTMQTAGGDAVTITPENTTPGVVEIQTVTFSAVPTAGVFKLNFAATATADINFNDVAGVIQTKVRTLPGLSLATVTGTPATSVVITFAGYVGNAALMTVSANTLTDVALDPVTPTVTESTAGVIAVQTLNFSEASNSGYYILSYGGTPTIGIQSGSSSAQVQAALRGIPALSAVTVAGSEGADFVVTFAGVSGPASLLVVAADTLVTSGGVAVTVAVATSVAGVPTNRISATVSLNLIPAMQYGLGQLQVFNSSTKEILLMVDDVVVAVIPPTANAIYMSVQVPNGSAVGIKGIASNEPTTGVLDINYVRAA